ncbi:MAG TPA: CAP domain-containing protein [Thermoanaerobaculia bacterium]
MSRITLAALLLAFAAPLFAADITPDTVLSEMNVYRAKEGLAPLHFDQRLVLAAGDRMQDMEDLAYWSHDAPDGRSPFTWLKPRGYDFRYAGENLATGFETVELLVQGWMESPGHRANIMSVDYDDVGIAVIDGSTTHRATGKSIVVMFGRRR